MPFFGGGGSSGGGSGSQTTYPVLSGSGAPGASLGSNGQIYIDTASDTLYGPKSGGSWGSGITLTGADYSEITNLPTTFTPASHVHPISEITNLQTELDGKTATGHSHAIADVTGLQTALDGKTATGHAHVIADVTGLQTELDTKALTTYVDSEVAAVLGNAPDQLDTLEKIADAINNNATYNTTIVGLISAKADSTHNHTLESLSNVAGSPLSNQYLRFDGANWIAVSLEDPSNTLAGLSDVSNVTPVNGEFLKYEDGQWFGSSISVDLSSNIGNLVASPASGTFEVRGIVSTVTPSATQSGAIQLNCSENSHGVKIVGPPHSAAATYTLTLPDDVGSAGQVLKTDGTGELSWLTIGGSNNAVTFSSVPATETSTGTVGEMALDALHLYVCVATNSWKRIPLQDFSGSTGGGGGSTTGIFISEQPSGGTSQNGNFNLSITATVPSGSTLNYQWQKYNTSTTAFDDVSGGVYSSLSLTNLTSSNDGDKYRCSLTSTGHSDVISSEAIIAVTDSGVVGVSSTKPNVLFDRSATNQQQVTNHKGIGGNWTYPGWTLIKEETQWQYSSTNLARVSTITGNTSPSYRTGEFTSWLKAIPAVDTGYINLEDYWNYNYQYNSNGYETLITENFSDFISNKPMDSGEMTYWNDTVSDDGKWNRAARFRTRVVLTRTVNGVEEQVTTNYSQWSDWRSDPAGNIINENSSTVFTTQPSTTAITVLPTSGNHTFDNLTAEIAGNNKRYVWLLNQDGQASPTASRNDIDIRGRISHDERSVSSSSQFAASINLNVEYLTLAGVGEYDLYCLGAADWNKAAFSSPIPVEIKSTTTNNFSMTEMAGAFTNPSSTQHGFSVSAKVLETSTNLVDNTINIRSGSIDFIIQSADSYGASVGDPDWRDFTTRTVLIDSSGSITNASDTYWTRQSNTRLAWRFSNIDIEVHGVWHTGVSTVWSKWNYS